MTATSREVEVLYLELYCTDGTGWRIAIPREDVIVSGGKATITNIPTIQADHACTIMDEFAVVTDETDQWGGTKPASGFVRLYTGRFNLNSQGLCPGDNLTLLPMEISVG